MSTIGSESLLLGSIPKSPIHGGMLWLFLEVVLRFLLLSI